MSLIKYQSGDAEAFQEVDDFRELLVCRYCFVVISDFGLRMFVFIVKPVFGV